MKIIESIETLELMLTNLNGKINFKFNGVNYGAMIAKDGKVIIKNFKSGVTIGKKQFLSQFLNNTYTPEIEYTEDTPTTIQNSDYKQCFEPCILSAEFIEFMQIKAFRSDYEVHEHIGLFNFDKLKELHPSLKVRGKRNILFFETNTAYNISVKWTKEKGWYSIKGTKANIGMFIKSSQKTSTLMLTEGLKDAINASIAFPTADILSINGKSNTYNFKAHGIDLADYKNIIFANDKDVREELTKMLPIEYKKHYKKVRCIDWGLVGVDSAKDLTDIIEHKIITECKTKRDLKRKGLPTLKKLLDKKSFLEEYAKIRVMTATKALNLAIDTDNKDMAMRAIKTLHSFEGDLKKGARYYLELQNKTIDKKQTVLNLKDDNRLSSFITDIVEHIKSNRHTFLNAPTGTGKSYVSLQLIPKHFKNIIIIAPFRMITNEHGGADTPFTDVRFDTNFQAIQADMNSDYIAVTTDAFAKLQTVFKYEFEERLKKADLIIFDEQHLYYDSLGFRDETVVKTYDYVLSQRHSKTLFMSGTLILPDKKDISLITAIVAEKNKENINFFFNPFDSISDIVRSITDQQQKGSVLIYVNSRAKVKEIAEVLSNNNISTLSITSRAYILDGKNVKDSILESDLGNIVYISTTKATTGVNFKNLKAIYQYGTPYTPNTFIQLVARLRSGGSYFLLSPKYTQTREEYNAKRAIGLTSAFKKLGITSVANSFYQKEFQKWLKGFVLLSHNNKTLKGFFKSYSEAFKLIESKGLGKFNEDNSDFTISSFRPANIEELFQFDDKNEFRKYIEQILIDWIVEHDIESLNDLYSLSYKITNATYKVSESKHHLVTEETKEAKREDRKEAKDEIKELHEEIDIKLEAINITAKQLKRNKFSDTELSSLNDKELHLESIAKLTDDRDKITALKFHVIPKRAIFKVANELLLNKDFVTTKELDETLQKIFITNKRHKNPYDKLLVELFNSKVFNDSYLTYSKSKRIDKKLHYNVLTISREHKKEFEAIKTKRDRKKFLKEKQEKELKRYNSYIELINTPSQHKFYDMVDIRKKLKQMEEERDIF